jgi:D-alanyl-D-alanine carboxypeptidase (penicillin-binding protein 5/6)
MPVGQALSYFARLMNAKAAELGALDTNFVNAHGFHHGNHVTTAYDLAQIARHAVSIPTIAEITAAAAFRGPMDGESGITRRWGTANELLVQGGANYYPYAFGLRTGAFAGLAGDTLVAAARRDSITLIAVTLNSPHIDGAETRWQDARGLFDYGFENYAYRTLLSDFEVLGQMPISNPRLGAEGVLEFVSNQELAHYLSLAEYGRLVVEFEFLERFITFSDVGEYDGRREPEMLFVGPVEYMENIGSVNFSLDGELLFSVPIHAAQEVLERTTSSDIDFYLERFRQIFFSRQSLPYWVAALSVLCLLTMVGFLLRNKIKEKRKHKKYKIKL